MRAGRRVPRTTQPQAGAQAKQRGLVFVANTATALDVVTSRLANVGISGAATTTRATGLPGIGYAVTAQAAGTTIYSRWPHHPAQNFGAGDFTLRILLSAVSDAGHQGAVFSNHGGSNQWGIYSNRLANGNSAGGASAGAISLLLYSAAVGSYWSIGASSMLDGLPHLFEWKRRGAVYTMRRDNVTVNEGGLTDIDVTGSKTVGPALYSNNNGDPTQASDNYSGTATVFHAEIWNRALINGEYPRAWDVYEPVDKRIWVPVSAGAGVTGTFANTAANDTFVSSGTTTVVATFSRTAANDTLAAAGTTTIVSAFSRTNANDTLVASGAVGGAITGAFATTSTNDTLSSSGTSSLIGVFTVTNLNDSFAGVGVLTLTSTFAATNTGDSLAAFGASGTSSSTFPPVAFYVGGNIAIGTNGSPIVLIF